MTRHGYTRAEKLHDEDDGPVSSVPPRLATASELLPEHTTVPVSHFRGPASRSLGAISQASAKQIPSLSSAPETFAPECVAAAVPTGVPLAVDDDPATPGPNALRRRLFGEPLSRVVRDRKLEQILSARSSTRQDQPLSTPEVLLVLKALESKRTTHGFSEVECARTLPQHTSTTQLITHINARMVIFGSDPLGLSIWQVQVAGQQTKGEARDAQPMTSPRVNTVHLRLKRALSGSASRVDAETLGMAGGKQRISPRPVLGRTVSAPSQASVLSDSMGLGAVAVVDPSAHVGMCSPRTRGRWWFANKQRRTIEEFSRVDLDSTSGSVERVRDTAACHRPMRAPAPPRVTWSILLARENGAACLTSKRGRVREGINNQRLHARRAWTACDRQRRRAQSFREATACGRRCQGRSSQEAHRHPAPACVLQAARWIAEASAFTVEVSVSLWKNSPAASLCF
jgi:hypothetical protein